MLLAPSQRIKPGPLRQALGDSVQELDHSLQSLKFTSSTRSKAGTDLHKLARLSPSHEPAKPASPKFWQSHLKTAAGHGRGLAIAYDKAASKLALTMSQYLKALTLDSATSRDVAPSAMAAAHQAAAPSTAGASRGPSSAGPLSRSSAVSTADTDADLEEFDRMVEGKGKDSQDNRAVPPCYKAQHAEGNKLKYVLHYSLTSSPSSTAAA